MKSISIFLFNYILTRLSIVHGRLVIAGGCVRAVEKMSSFKISPFLALDPLRESDSVRVVEEDKNMIILESAGHQDLAQHDHSGESAVITTKINDNKGEIDERVYDGRCNLHGNENLLAGLRPCRSIDKSISIQRLHLNFIFGASPIIVHNRVFKSLWEILN